MRLLRMIKLKFKRAICNRQAGEFYDWSATISVARALPNAASEDACAPVNVLCAVVAGDMFICYSRSHKRFPRILKLTPARLPANAHVTEFYLSGDAIMPKKQPESFNYLSN